MVSNPVQRSNHKVSSLLLLLLVGLMVAASLLPMALAQTMSQAVGQEALEGQGSNVVQARLGKGTESLLKQTASHMSKLLGGESIGGFPGFEPPDDDEQYKDKIRNQSYSVKEANHWIKEINNLLRQVVKKNPNKSLEQILQQMGWQQHEIEEFVIALRNTHYIAKSWKEVGIGISPATLADLEALMKILGVAPWL